LLRRGHTLRRRVLLHRLDVAEMIQTVVDEEAAEDRPPNHEQRAHVALQSPGGHAPSVPQNFRGCDEVGLVGNAEVTSPAEARQRRAGEAGRYATRNASACSMWARWWRLCHAYRAVDSSTVTRPS